MRHPARVLALLLASAAVVPTAPTDTARAAAGIPSDFNGDGYADLAIGVPEEDVPGTRGAGAVNVLYGGSAGLSSAGNQVWYESTARIPDRNGAGDKFGFALVPGDFDGDGRGDLAIGAPFEDLGPLPNAGQVVVLYGSRTGLRARRSQLWTQDSPDIAGQAQARDQFGYSLAAGDFDGDGYADLAIGVQREDVGRRNAGAVQVLYGSAEGLAADRNQLWWQGSSGMPDAAEKKDQLGNALAAGDFDGDGYAELAIATQREDLGPIVDAGAVTILRGSSVGLTGVGSQFWTQDSSGILDDAETGDRFGRGLATGDLNGDLRADLVIGTPLEDLADRWDVGAVSVLYGSSSGLSADGNQLWTQDSQDVPGTAGAGDQFGKAFAVGDLDDDGRDDLAVGVRYDDPSGTNDAGIVNVLYGTSAGLAASRAQLWTQAMPDAPDPVESPDHFGSCLAAADFGKSPAADLVVGAHFETLGSKTYAGAAHVLYGDTSGLTAVGSQFWTQDSPDVLDQADPFDYFPAAFGVAGSARCG